MLTGWQQKELKYLTRKIGSGATPLGGKEGYQKKGLALIRSLNIYDFNFVEKDLAFINEKQAYKLKNVEVLENDVLLNITGASVARCCIVPKHILPARVNQHVSIIRADKESLNPFFLHYLLISPQYKQRLLSLSQSGATREAITKEFIANFKISYPDIAIQCKIASILSAYDNLIKNNNKRIKILEEIAQKLYKEWFIDFKFPGHENTKFIESEIGRIPQEWKVMPLNSQLAELEAGKRPKGGIIEGIKDGIPSIGAENINGIGRHSFDKEKFVSKDFFQKMCKGIVRDRDVAIYKDGAYIGRSSYFRDEFPYKECCVNEHVFLLRTNNKSITQNILYLWLQEIDSIQKIRATNANAAQPGINQKSIGNINIIIPDKRNAVYFDQLVEPLLKQIINFSKQNYNLQKTRDFLLPRLISGELSVEDLDIKI